MAIAHFAVGAAGALVLARVLAPRAVRSPAVPVAGGLWAILPDAYWVLPAGSAPVRAIHQSAVANVFWLHGWLDAVDPSNARRLAAVALLGLLVVAVLAELSAPERVDRRTGEPE